MNARGAGAPPGNGIKLTLCVAGSNRYSRQARTNLGALLAALEPDTESEVIDVVQQPERALSQGIMATPALIALVRGTRLLFIGDLSEQDKVLSALRADG
jgi:hypothetical protein